MVVYAGRGSGNASCTSRIEAFPWVQRASRTWSSRGVNLDFGITLLCSVRYYYDVVESCQERLHYRAVATDLAYALARADDISCRCMVRLNGVRTRGLYLRLNS